MAAYFFIPATALYTVTGRILESMFIRNMHVRMHW